MSDATEPGHIGHHHRATLKRIQEHPTAHNLEWDDVIRLLDDVADVTERHDGKFGVKIGDEAIVLTKPKHKDVDEQTVIDLRRMLKDAGIIPIA